MKKRKEKETEEDDTRERKKGEVGASISVRMGMKVALACWMIQLGSPSLVDL